MGFGLHGLVIVRHKLPWIGTCCRLWPSWSTKDQGHGPWLVNFEVLRRLYLQCRQVPKSWILMESWRSGNVEHRLSHIASTWFPNFILRLLSQLDCASMANKLCTWLLIKAWQFYICFMHWFTPVCRRSFIGCCRFPTAKVPTSAQRIKSRCQRKRWKLEPDPQISPSLWSHVVTCGAFPAISSIAVKKISEHMTAGKHNALLCLM